MMREIEMTGKNAQRCKRSRFVSYGSGGLSGETRRSFRQAHEIIGKLVAFSIQHQRPFTELTLLEYRQFSDRFAEDVLLYESGYALRSRTASARRRQKMLRRN